MSIIIITDTKQEAIKMDTWLLSSADSTDMAWP